MNKILPLPEEFSGNEWFVILSLLITYTIMFSLRKKYPASFMILLLLFSATIARIADHILAGPPLDWYDLMDTPVLELFDLFSYFLYGPFAFFFVYLYEKFQVRGLYTILYIVVWAGFSVGYEWITVLADVFSFKDWEPLYSFPVYLFTQTLTLCFYHIFQGAWHRQGSTN